MAANNYITIQLILILCFREVQLRAIELVLFNNRQTKQTHFNPSQAAPDARLP